MELTIGGEARLLGKGDTYYIPAGVEHSAVFRSPTKAMDLFAEASRYRPKGREAAPQYGEPKIPILGHAARPNLW